MSNETQSSFPSSRQDISDLKQTAMDAARDLKSTASVHAAKAQGQLRQLADHAQAEGGARFDDMKGSLSDLSETARGYITARPMACVGVALAVGFLFGLTRRGR